MARKLDYETMVRNFTTYEQKLAECTQVSEIPMRHVVATITAMKNEKTISVSVGSKAYTQYSAKACGLILPDMKKCDLKELFFEAGAKKDDCWEIKEIEVGSDDLKLLNAVCGLPVFDDYVKSRQEKIKEAAEIFVKAFTGENGPNENMDKILDEITDCATKIISLYGENENGCCSPFWTVNDDMSWIPCFATPGKCKNANCIYRAVVKQPE